MRKFKITDLETEESMIIDEVLLRKSAEWHYRNSDVDEEIDFSIVENCIEFINRVEPVEEIKEDQDAV